MAYCQLRKRLQLDISGIYSVRKEISSLNKAFCISSAQWFAFNDINQKLDFVLKNAVNKYKIDQTLKIKLCADTTNIGRKLKILIFNFSVIYETDICKTAAGHYIIGAYIIEKESYEELKNFLSTVFQQVEMFNQYQNLKVEKFLDGDWKFLSSFVGINSANSN